MGLYIRCGMLECTVAFKRCCLKQIIGTRIQLLLVSRNIFLCLSEGAGIRSSKYVHKREAHIVLHGGLLYPPIWKTTQKNIPNSLIATQGRAF